MQRPRASKSVDVVGQSFKVLDAKKRPHFHLKQQSSNKDLSFSISESFFAFLKNPSFCHFFYSNMLNWVSYTFYIHILFFVILSSVNWDMKPFFHGLKLEKNWKNCLDYWQICQTMCKAVDFSVMNYLHFHSLDAFFVDSGFEGIFCLASSFIFLLYAN